MAEWQDTLIQGGFVFLVISAMLIDLSTLRVPNWLTLSLFGLFLLHGVTGENGQAVGAHMLIGIAVLAGGFWLFTLGVLGGGDVKLGATLTLWMGPGHLGAFLLLAAIFSGLVALAMICLKKLLIFNPALESFAAIARPAALAREGKLPFAVPLGLAALILGPELFV